MANISKSLLWFIGVTYTGGVSSVIGYSIYKNWKTVNEEKIIWELFIPSKENNGKGNLCLRLEDPKIGHQKGCLTKWSKENRGDETVKGEMWIRFKKDSIKYDEISQDSLDLQNIFSQQKEKFWNIKGISEIKEINLENQDRMCKVTENQSDKWVELKCHEGKEEDLE